MVFQDGVGHPNLGSVQLWVEVTVMWKWALQSKGLHLAFTHRCLNSPSSSWSSSESWSSESWYQNVFIINIIFTQRCFHLSPSSSSESESLISHWPLENKKRQIDLGKKNGFSRHNYDSQVCEIQNSSLVGASLPWTWTKCTQAVMHHDDVKWQQVEAMKNGD